MSKFKCLCGHIIVDQSFNLPYKAQYFAEEDYAVSYEQLIILYTDFIRAREAGEQERFIEKHFGKEYPKDLDLSDILSDMLAGMRAVFGHDIYECEQCGRLWLEPAYNKQKRDVVYELLPYLPEREVRRVLHSKREE